MSLIDRMALTYLNIRKLDRIHGFGYLWAPLSAALRGFDYETRPSESHTCCDVILEVRTSPKEDFTVGLLIRSTRSIAFQCVFASSLLTTTCFHGREEE